MENYLFRLGRNQLRNMYHRPVDEVTGFVLAGGRSSRMGRDKAFLTLGGETLLSRALGQARLAASNVYIVGEPQRFADWRFVVADIFTDRGPLAGIHAALSSTATELNLVLAVDTPFIPRRLLEVLLAKARACGAIVTVPRTGGRFHPLCAIYRREFAAISEQSLLRGRNKIAALFGRVESGEVEINVVEEEELLRLGLHPDIFRNLNTPDDWHEAELLYGSSKTDSPQLKTP